MKKICLTYLFFQVLFLNSASANICVDLKKFEKSLAVEIVEVIGSDGVDSHRYDSALILNAALRDFSLVNDCKEKVHALAKECSALHDSYKRKCDLSTFDFDFCSSLAKKLYTCNANGFTE